METTINLREKLSRFQELWSPKIVASLNNYHIKVVKLQGEFVWHSHTDTDEFFLVIDGRLIIELSDGLVALNPGELFVVPKGTEHRPVAAQECHILLIEPAGTVNTGEAGGKLTTAGDAWI